MEGASTVAGSRTPLGPSLHGPGLCPKDPERIHEKEWNDMSESLSILRDSLPYLLKGTSVTLIVVCGALLFGLALGLPLAVSPFPPPKRRHAGCSPVRRFALP